MDAVPPEGARGAHDEKVNVKIFCPRINHGFVIILLRGSSKVLAAPARRR